ncbi:hypothetical protein [Azospirillum humicireducens]|uniref:hypothetical protein n=1 Tax=Azospirillum humicireducens TaxID=1226968 RepID=UPI003AAF4516
MWQFRTRVPADLQAVLGRTGGHGHPPVAATELDQAVPEPDRPRDRPEDPRRRQGIRPQSGDGERIHDQAVRPPDLGGQRGGASTGIQRRGLASWTPPTARTSGSRSPRSSFKRSSPPRSTPAARTTTTATPSPETPVPDGDASGCR